MGHINSIPNDNSIYCFWGNRTVAAKVSGPIVAFLPLDNLPTLIYWPLRLLIIFLFTKFYNMVWIYVWRNSECLTFKKDKFIFKFFFNLSIKMSKKMMKWLSFGILFKN